MVLARLCGARTTGEGLLLYASTEGSAFGLDPASGEVRWQTRITDQQYAGSITNLLYHDGLLYLGLSSVEEVLTEQNPGYQPKFRGAVLALEAKTGRQAWTCQLCSPGHTGCSVWSSFALDPASGTLFFDTGNNYAGAASEHSDSMIAADARSGAINGPSRPGTRTSG